MAPDLLRKNQAPPIFCGGPFSSHLVVESSLWIHSYSLSPCRVQTGSEPGAREKSRVVDECVPKAPYSFTPGNTEIKLEVHWKLPSY